MSPINSSQISASAIFSYGCSNMGNKKTRIKASTLLDNVAIYAVKTYGNDVQFIALEGNKKQDEFSDSLGTVQVAALLKPTWANQNSIIVGAGASADGSSDFAAAKIDFLTQNYLPTQYTPINTYPGATSWLNTSCIPNDYLLIIDKPNLKDRYVILQLEYYNVGENRFGEIETSVEIHVLDSNGNLLGIMYDTTKPGNDEGDNWSDIKNNMFYLDMDNLGIVYLLPLIKYTFSNGEVVFTIGDPKTDAAVSVDEV